MLTPEIINAINSALHEDVGTGDVTTLTIVPSQAQMCAHIMAKQDGVVAGLEVAEAVFHSLDPQVKFTYLVKDGAQVKNRQSIAKISGSAHALMIGERTAMNFLGRMSGIATMTQQFVTAVAGTKTKILDTRKTAPGLRQIDKWAVKLGGGQNHRMGLYDMILIKDNHIDFCGSLEKAVQQARDGVKKLSLPQTLQQVP